MAVSDSRMKGTRAGLKPRGNPFLASVACGSQLKFRPWGEIEEYAQKNVTLCDYDTGKRSPTLLSMWKVARVIKLTPSSIRYDRTEHGWHVTIAWPHAFIPSEIVALQSVLGSDPSREAFNLARAMSGTNQAGRKRWNLLYRRKLES